VRVLKKADKLLGGTLPRWRNYRRLAKNPIQPWPEPEERALS
jgi:hypothetical protein